MAMIFFDSSSLITLSCYITIHRAGSQLKIPCLHDPPSKPTVHCTRTSKLSFCILGNVYELMVWDRFKGLTTCGSAVLGLLKGLSDTTAGITPHPIWQGVKSALHKTAMRFSWSKVLSAVFFHSKSCLKLTKIKRAHLLYVRICAFYFG